MIKMSFSEKNESIRQKSIENYFGEIYTHIQRGYKTLLNSYCLRNRRQIVEPLICERPKEKDKIEKDPFCYLMSAGFQTLKSIKENMDHDLPIMFPLGENVAKYLTTTLFNKIDHKKFISFFDSRVCPYCNRNYIGDSRAKTNIRYELDHFWPRDDYPIFAACFYNLVPVCACCNGTKSTTRFTYSPYDDCDIDKELRMTYKLKSAAYLHDPDAIDVIIKASAQLSGNIKALKLDEIYKLHSDTVQELLWKKKIYCRSYVLSMNSMLKLSKDEMERLITGNYCDKNNYGKRPLSKLTADISREIGLI